MAFLFKSKNKQGAGLPPANRNLASSDGPNSNTNNPNPNSNSTTADFKDGAEKSRFGSQAPTPVNSIMIARGATPDQYGSHAPDLKQVSHLPQPSALLSHAIRVAREKPRRDDCTLCGR